MIMSGEAAVEECLFEFCKDVIPSALDPQRVSQRPPQSATTTAVPLGWSCCCSFASSPHFSLLQRTNTPLQQHEAPQ